MLNKTLRIATWNSNGLQQHLPELEIFLNIEHIDICLISESHYTLTSYAKIGGYCFYHATHPSQKARGGSAIFVRESIKHHADVKIEKESMQVTAVHIELSRGKKFLVSAIYCPPRFNLKKEDYKELLRAMGNYFIIGGDFNAKNTYWGSRLTTPKGRNLYAAGTEMSCDFLSGSNPTYWPTDTNKNQT